MQVLAKMPNAQNSLFSTRSKRMRRSAKHAMNPLHEGIISISLMLCLRPEHIWIR